MANRDAKKGSVLFNPIELGQRIYYHRVDIRHRPHRRVTKLTAEQKNLFDQLEIGRPTIEVLIAAV
jgi:hypothetical protein